MKITIVPDQACPRCGAWWGNPDPALDFPNRIKVDNDWRCYNPDCTCAYYRDGKVLEDKLSPEDHAAMVARVHAQVAAQMEGRIWITKGNASKLHPEGEPLPAGWKRTGS